MSTITVRGLDDVVVRALKLRAAREGRSMEAEVRSILTAAAKGTENDRGFGSFLTTTFAGAGAPEIPARTEFPEPVDLT
ncbi:MULTISPECIES: FitA-like ribbon-helix-helix domain-containing protein [Actinomycetes]|uniref:Toxin-antitoxin system antitoxin subunit n=1 Tax=Microbacterium profundi TaxID=450380 RepID=A0ABV3LKD3_9MICO